MFVKQVINSGRQRELDLARGLAVLAMVLIHAQLFFANESVVLSGFGSVNEFIGTIPAAPMFMFLLGVGMVYTRETNPKRFWQRGLWLLVAGYGLNFFKGSLPALLTLDQVGVEGALAEASREFFYVDILHFSGLACLWLSLYKWRQPRMSWQVGMLVGFGLLNAMLTPIQAATFPQAALSGLIWGSSELAYFPFITWIVYPLAGYLFGTGLQHCRDKRTFYTWLLIGGSLGFIGGSWLQSLLGIQSGLASEWGYYHHQWSDQFIFIAFLGAELAVLFFVGDWLPERGERVLQRWSRNVTEIFVVHWLLITWGALIVDYQRFGLFAFVVIVVGILVSSDAIAMGIQSVRRRT